MFKIYIGLYLTGFMLIAMAGNKDMHDLDMVNYAATQVTDCTLGDGYVCETINEDDFLSIESLNGLIPAIYLQAWQPAYNAFLELDDLDVSQKELRHYRIGFTQSQAAYVILFSALLLPEKIVNNEPVGASRLTYGKTVKFWVNKKTLKVTKYLYYK